MDNQTPFRYTYSAKQQAEIKAIREKYTAPTEDKMAQVRRLDAAVAQKATVIALVVGILGALVLGLGMSLILSDLGATLGLSSAAALWIGIPVGIVGAVPVGLAFPLYNRTVKKERARVAPEILRLTDELLQQ